MKTKIIYLMLSCGALLSSCNNDQHRAESTRTETTRTDRSTKGSTDQMDQGMQNQPLPSGPRN